MRLVLVIMQDGHQVNISIMIIIVDEEEREGHHRVVGDVLAPDVGALAAASLVWQIKYFATRNGLQMITIRFFRLNYFIIIKILSLIPFCSIA